MKTAQDLTIKDSIYEVKNKEVIQHKIFAISDLGQDGIRFNLEKKATLIAKKDSYTCKHLEIDYYFNREDVLPSLIILQEQRVKRIERDLELATGYLNELRKEKK